MNDVIITVRGEHEVQVEPERGIAQISVVAESSERGAVVERIAALTEPVRDDLIARKTAGSLEEWTSERASVWADRPWNADGRQLPLVHHAAVGFTVTFTDFSALSWWATEVVDHEGVQFGGVHWELTPHTRAEVERRVATDAVAVATARAQAYATALGLSTIVPLELSDRGLLSHEVAPLVMARGMAADSGPALDFQPEKITIASGVDARFTAR